MRNLPIRLFTFLLLTTGLILGQRAKPKHESGLLIEATSYDPCHGDCAPFDRPINFFCARIGEQVLVGSRKADWRWMYDSRKMFEQAGKPISIRYDARSVWIVRPDGNEMHLDRRVIYDPFVDSGCAAEVRRGWLEILGQPPRPQNVLAGTVVVPQSDQDFWWMKCDYDSSKDADRCTIWSSGGVDDDRLHPGEWGEKTSGKAIPAERLLIDPLTTRDHFEVHLKDGTILKRR